MKQASATMETRRFSKIKSGENTEPRRFNWIKVWPWLFCAPFLIVYLVFTLYPTIYSFYLSLHEWNGFTARIFVGLQNYRNLLTVDLEFFHSLWVTLRIMIISIPGQIIIGLILAQLIFNLVRGKRFFQTVYFIPFIIAPAAVALMFRYVFEFERGYLNHLLVSIGLLQENVFWMQTRAYVQPILGIITVWRQMGYSMVILLAAMTAISVDLYDAAKVDGANGWHQFWYITIPQIRYMIIFLILTSIIGGFQMFEIPSLIYTGISQEATHIGGPGGEALTVMWKFFNDTFQTGMRLGYGAAISYLLFLAILLVSIVVRFITSRFEREDD